MTMTDPVADFLTRVRNGLHAQRQEVRIPASRLKRELARILVEEGYITSYEDVPPGPGNPGGEIKITLKYTGNRAPVISGLERISRPGRRTYVDHTHIPRVQGGMGTAASASLAPGVAGATPIFEPVHGSAPDIAGQGIANPIGAIWSAVLMLETLGEADASARLMRALEDVCRSGLLTRDLGGTATTADVGKAVAERV